MHKVGHPRNYFLEITFSFTHYQTEWIKKGVTCVQIFVKNTPDWTK